MSNFIDKNYKKWYNYAKIITNNKEAEDLLHNLLITMLEKYPLYEPLKWNDNFIFISLKNSFLTRTTSKKNKMVDTNIDVSTILDIEEEGKYLEELIKDEFDIQSKLDCISNTVIKLNQFERKLYQLHFIYGLSQRKIAREIGVSHLTINQRINKIKQKIKQNYGN